MKKFTHKDLMIGDYVYNHRNWICPVVSIESNYVTVMAGIYGECTYDSDDISPIPIDENVLEKNFNKDEDGYFSLGKGMYIHRDDNGSFCLYNTYDVGYGEEINYIATIEYVHELQHFLRLIEYEGEFKL